ncbi:hypothetical protein GCM10023322_09030 [Rugosimonospora acidiphila]|uniref:Arabinogalactan endo-beta-1,4-galactanase n=1 Tax=Rugosimonospora acidiphila TaxID=556531 RepID=A0ABP9RK51_9ACTN
MLGTVMAATAGLPAVAGPAQAATLAPLPDGLNVAIGRHVSADTGSAPGSSLAAAIDGDGTSRWCPSTVGPHTLTVDLGRVTQVTGTGVTFSGEEGNDGSFYSVTTGVNRPDQTPLPHQAPGDRNGIVQGPLYLFAGSAADADTTVKARYVTLHYQVPREQNICVQEFRVFSDTATSDPTLQLGGDLTGLVADDAQPWSSGGTTESMLSILTSGGMNYGRVRLLVNPTDCGATCADLTNGLAVAKRLKAAGMKVSLELDYSDTPTSSAAQPIPAAWSGQSLSTLARSVRDYTRSVIAAFAANGTPVAEVSLGNDISQGMLWPSGQLRFGSTGHADWSGLTTLLAAGAQGARDGAPRGKAPLIQVVLDSGADNTASVDFLNHLSNAHVPFDVIGEAYLPWRNGSFTALAANLRDLAARYHKPLVVAESEFPYANISGFGSYSTTVPYPDTLPGYAISPAGQASYQRDLVSLLASLPGHEGRGVFYSTPDTAGSLGWFTAAGAAQPAADAFRVGSSATLYHGRSLALSPSVTGTTGAAQPATDPAATELAATNDAAGGAGQPDAAPQPGTLPPLPAGLDAAIGAKASTQDGAAPGTPVGNVADGDGTSAWCPGTLGTHTVTIDLGRPVDITGTGVTFSGEQSGDGATYQISTGLEKPGRTPFPHQAAGADNPVNPGALYLFAGSAANTAATVKARYVTLTYQEPRERNVCVQELRVFSTDAHPAANLELGADLSTLISDTATYTLNGTSEPILSIFKDGGLNYVRLRLWIDPGRPDCSTASCPSLANDLAMAKQIKAAGMGLLLDFHYSDTWADPQHQNVPSAWAGQTLDQLATSIHDYTQSVIAAFAANGTPVDQAAIGNEITQGTIWAATSIAGASGTVVPAGTTTIKVASTSGIRPGDTLFIDAGANLVPNQLTETDRVVSVGTAGPDGTGITLAEPLEFDHNATVAVQDVQASGKLLFDPRTGKADWTSLTTLLRSAVQGAKAGNPAGHQLLIQLHVDRGADNATTVDWFNHMVAAGVPFDVIGESYYPWYHGPMSAMQANLTALVNRFHKYVMIAEDQFPQNPQGGYGTYNAANANYPDTLPGYLVTPAGQASYQRDLNSIVASLPEGKGLGVFYWDGDGQGNLGMFNQQHAAQPVIYANQVGAASQSKPKQ